MPFSTLCWRERSVCQHVVERADEQGHVFVPRAVGGPLSARHVDVVVHPFDAVHHRLSRRLQTGRLGQLCRYHGNDFLRWTAEREKIEDCKIYETAPPTGFLCIFSISDHDILILLLHKQYCADYAALVSSLCHFEGIALLAQV